MECSLSLESGTVIESSQGKGTVQFRCGSGKVLPKLEEELVGLAGQTLNFHIVIRDIQNIL